jgi:hypothetical protein
LLKATDFYLFVFVLAYGKFTVDMCKSILYEFKLNLKIR